VVVVVCFISQGSMDVFAGRNTWVSFFVVCLSPDSSQHCLRGASYDRASPSQGLAWRSSHMNVIAEGDSNMKSCSIHLKISRYSVSCALVFSCGM